MKEILSFSSPPSRSQTCSRESGDEQAKPKTHFSTVRRGGNLAHSTALRTGFGGWVIKSLKVAQPSWL